MTAFPKKPSTHVKKRTSFEAELHYKQRLKRITHRIHSADNTTDILLNLQGEILSLFKAERITVYVVEGTKKHIVSQFKTGDEINEIRVPINTDSIAGYCAVAGKAAIVNNVDDVKELNRIHPSLKFDRTWDQKTGYKTRRVLVSPITHKNFLLGVIQLTNKKEGMAFTREDQSAVRDIAQVLGLAFFKNKRIADNAKPKKFDYLLLNNLLTPQELSDAASLARQRNHSIESILISDFHVSKEHVGKALSAFYQVPFITYHKGMAVPKNILAGLKESFLKRNRFVPVSQTGKKVIVAMETPDDLSARDAIKHLIRAKNLIYGVAIKEDILKIIEAIYHSKDMGKTKNRNDAEDVLVPLKPGGGNRDLDGLGMAEDDNAVVGLINKVIIDAFHLGASDIHIEPKYDDTHAVIRIRVDGGCQSYKAIPHTLKRAIVSRIKIMADLDIAERRLPQDGKIKFKKYAPLDIELRVATIPTAGQNEDLVLRIVSGSGPVPLDRMGMSLKNYSDFVDLITKPYGLVLVVGPTGSGKTTTLHAALGYINKPDTKIWTAEDPVEITQDGLRQVQVLPKIGFDFTRAMRAFLRADPDVIMVGEMRDRETAATGIEASLTGHLVLSTLHTNSAPETIVRLLDMGMDSFNFSDAFLGVLAQRLVKTLCSECKEKYRPTESEYKALVRAYDNGFDKLGHTFGENFFLYRPNGCSACAHTGYRGRTGIHELIIATDELKSLIQKKAGMGVIRSQAVNQGMKTLMQDGIRKVCLGETTLTQVRKVCMR